MYDEVGGKVKTSAPRDYNIKLEVCFLWYVCKISRLGRAIPSKDIDLKPGNITHSQAIFLEVLMDFRLKQPTKQIMEAYTSHIFLFFQTRMPLLVWSTFRALKSVFAASELIRASEMKEIYSYDSFVAWTIRTVFP